MFWSYVFCAVSLLQSQLHLPNLILGYSDTDMDSFILSYLQIKSLLNCQ